MPLPKLYTIDDLFDMLPAKGRPKPAKLQEMVTASGCYRDFGGTAYLLDEDVAAFLQSIRGKPTAAELQKRQGPARLLSLDAFADDTAGLMVAIGDPMMPDGPVFVSWCPTGSVNDMLTLVQFGNPEPLAVLMFLPATPGEVAEHRRVIGKRTRTDETNWFVRSAAVNAYLSDLREAVLGAETEIEIEENEQ